MGITGNKGMTCRQSGAGGPLSRGMEAGFLLSFLDVLTLGSLVVFFAAIADELQKEE